MATKKKQPAAPVEVVQVPRNYIRTSANYHLGDDIKDMENPDPVSLTVPDMTMSLKDLISRHVRGLPVPSLGQPVFSDDEIPDIERMDLAELEAMQYENKYQISILQEQLEEAERQQQLLENSPKPIKNPQTDDLPPEVV